MIDTHKMECKGKQCIEETDEEAMKSDMRTSTGNGSNGCDDEADLDNNNEAANNCDYEAADLDNDEAADLDNVIETANNYDDEAADLDNANETGNNGSAVSVDSGSGSGSQCNDLSLNDTVLTNGSFDASPNFKDTDNVEGITGSDSHSEAKCDESGTPCERTNLSPSSTNHGTLEMEEKPQDQPNVVCGLTGEISNGELLIK